VHDGRFKRTAKFDHSLYYQTPRRTAVGEYIPYGAFENDAVGWSAPNDSYEGLVASNDAMLMRKLRKRLPNADTWIAA
jgi:hypothetical protein